MARQIVKKGLTETEHALIDHSGIEGVGVESFTETVHDEHDHTGIDGVLSEETFTQEDHDAEDHSSIPGVPDITGLLDETAHDSLDHTGLTGVPAAETFDQATHDLEDHSSIPGVPSISGLLDESAHDLLDHTGLTGIPDSIPLSIKDSVETVNDLPVNIEVALLDEQTGYTAGSSIYDYIQTVGNQRAAELFTGAGQNTYYIDCDILGGPGGGALRAFIYSNNAGNPDTQLFASDELTSGIVPQGEVLSFRFTFTDINLVDGTQYWAVFGGVSGKTNIRSNNHGSAGSHKFFYAVWASPGWRLYIKVSRAGVISSYEQDIRLVEDEHKLYVFDGMSWILLPVESYTQTEHGLEDHSSQLGVPSIVGLLDETAHDALDHSGLTGIPSITGLLDETAHDALDHTGLTGVGSQQWKESVADSGDLPGVLGVYATTGTKNAAGFSDNYNSTYHAASFAGNGEGNYQLKSEWAYDSSSITLTGYIYTDNAGKPGTLVATSDANHVGTVTAGQEIIFDFTGVNLVQGTTYWYVAKRIAGATANMEKRITEASSAGARGSDGLTWTNCQPMWVEFSFSGGIANIEGDALIQNDIKQIKVWNGTAWVAVAPTANNTAVDDVEESATPTSVELKINELLDVLRTSGIIAS